MKLIKQLIVWCKRNLWTHKWSYHNPYNRRCTVCDRHEVGHYNAGSHPSKWFWEEFNEGDEGKHHG